MRLQLLKSLQFSATSVPSSHQFVATRVAADIEDVSEYIN
jgi:hypothetical protein